MTVSNLPKMNGNKWGESLLIRRTGEDFYNADWGTNMADETRCGYIWSGAHGYKTHLIRR